MAINEDTLQCQIPQSLPNCTKLLTTYLGHRVQQHAPSLKEINVRESIGTAFNLIERQIYEEARREAVRPTTIPDGEMRELTKYDATVRPFIEWHGSPKAWLGEFSNGAKKRLAGIRTESQRGYIPSR